MKNGTDQRQSTHQVLLTEDEAATRLAVSKRSLQAWRWRNCGPSFVKLNGAAVRYTESALNDYIAIGTRSNTSEVA